VFDALVTDRAHRPAFSVKEAIAIMRDEEYKYDPELLRLLRRNVNKWMSE